MTEEQIIEAWAWVRKNNNSIPDDVLDFMKDSAIAALQNKGEWISVKDAIPKVVGRYSKIVKTKTSSGKIIDNRFDAGIKDWQFSFSENITHWQPLPTPPEIVTK